MPYDPHRALELLRIGCEMPAATFREGQEEAIRYAVEGRGRLLVVQRTGWGKSFVYFIATKLLRESGAGPALLISPLLALMRNQIAAASRMGVRAVTINSDNVRKWDDIEKELRRDAADILLISPERLANHGFRNEVLQRIAGRISLLVIDEAHCISDWGHDFRPQYRLLERMAGTLPPNLRLVATTATANDRVMEDLCFVLGPGLRVMRGDLRRPSLTLQTIRMGPPAERLAWLAEHLPQFPGSGIIYTLTVRDANRVAAWLRSRGLKVEPYTAETGPRREELEHALLENRVKALVATTALGMGFDKPDLAFVIHYQAPGSVVAYYQQVGRAGRAIPSAYGILLGGDEDQEIAEFFIQSAFPTPEEVAAVIGALQNAPHGLSDSQLMARVNLGKMRIEKTMELLALESPPPVAQHGKTWQLTAARLSDSFWQRAERLTELRHFERRQMEQYINLHAGHMEFLIRALDGAYCPTAGSQLPPLPRVADAGLVQEAESFLRNSGVVIDPRKKWPPGGLPCYGVDGIIPPRCRIEPGRALCVWGDAGWGPFVRDGKYLDGEFCEQLVQACAHMVRLWNPQPHPTWVTCIPSLRHPMLVRRFAEQLACALGLRFAMVLRRTGHRPEQKTMANNTQQARNLDGALELTCNPLPSRPVLLVDDLVDSRWTFTVAGWLLRQHGCGQVFPVALSYVGQRQ